MSSTCRTWSSTGCAEIDRPPEVDPASAGPLWSPVLPGCHRDTVVRFSRARRVGRPRRRRAASALVEFVGVGGTCRVARDLLAVRLECDPDDHVPGGWRFERMVATVPRGYRPVHCGSRGRRCAIRGGLGLVWRRGGWPAVPVWGRYRRGPPAIEAYPPPRRRPTERTLGGSTNLDAPWTVTLFPAVRGVAGRRPGNAGYYRDRISHGVGCRRLR